MVLSASESFGREAGSFQSLSDLKISAASSRSCSQNLSSGLELARSSNTLVEVIMVVWIAPRDYTRTLAFIVIKRYLEILPEKEQYKIYA